MNAAWSSSTMEMFQVATKLCSQAGSEAPAMEAKRAKIGSKYSLSCSKLLR